LVSTLSGCLPSPTVTVSSSMEGAHILLQPPAHHHLGLQHHLSQDPSLVQGPLAAIASIGGGKKRPRDPGDDLLLALPAGSVMPYKRAAAADKSGLPVYQPVQQQMQPAAAQQQAATYHQILQMQQPNIVPVSYGSTQPLAIPRYQ